MAMPVRWCVVLIGGLGAVAAVPVSAAPLADRVVRVGSTAETTPVRHTRDAADDPAIWVNRNKRSHSLVIGNDKQGALEVYSLDGRLLQRITSTRTFWGNVDVRQRVTVAGSTYDLVGAMNGGLRLYSVDPATRALESVTEKDKPIRTGGGEGLCLYHPRSTGKLYAFVVARNGRVRQFKITDGDHDGKLSGRQVRQLSMGSESEGCVADDALRRVYVSEEDVGLWRLRAAPDVAPRRVLVDRVGGRGHLVRDVEGVTLAVTGRRTGYLIVSAQNSRHPQKSYFAVYGRRTNAYRQSFRIVAGPNSDGCERTDGVVAYVGSLGRRYPKGLFVCQDDRNTAPRVGGQDFKLTRLETTGTLPQ